MGKTTQCRDGKKRVNRLKLISILNLSMANISKDTSLFYYLCPIIEGLYTLLMFYIFYLLITCQANNLLYLYCHKIFLYKKHPYGFL